MANTVVITAPTTKVAITEAGGNGVVVSSRSSVDTVHLVTEGPQGPPGPPAVILESQQVISENWTIRAGYNGLSIGPVSVAAGYTVIVPAGAFWRIL